jgi:hypothetical protein
MLGRYNGNPVTAGGVDNFIENTFDMGLVSRESWYVRRRRVGPAPSGMLAPRRDCEGSQRCGATSAAFDAPVDRLEGTVKSAPRFVGWSWLLGPVSII